MFINSLSIPRLLIALQISLAFCATANALPITDLYNTGVNDSGVALGPGVSDPHYVLSSQPASGSLIATTVPNGFPIPPWIANSATSGWIGPNTPQAFGPVGLYTYQTTFTLPALADLSTVLVGGLYAVDNVAIDIVINGVSVGTGQLSTGFRSYTPFTISSNFALGLNTLAFVLENLPSGDNPTGLRVDSIQGSYEERQNTIPEPSTLLLVGIAAIGFGIQARRRNDKSSERSRDARADCC